MFIASAEKFNTSPGLIVVNEANTLPSADPTHWQFVGSVEDVHMMHVGDRQQVLNFMHKAKIVIVVNPAPQLSKHFDNFIMIGPQNDYFTRIAVNTENQSAEDINLDSSKKGEYEKVDERWYSTIPISVRGDYMTGQYLIATMEMDNAVLDVDGLRSPTQSRNKSIKLIAVITKYKQAF